MTRDIAQPSLAGIIIALASLVLMPLLAWQKYRVGTALGSKALVADSKETLACSWLSLTLLLGLIGNYNFRILASGCTGQLGDRALLDSRR